jgi:biofilm PGA synthesis lipoprotein PgaB
MPVSSYKLQPAQVADIYEDLSRYSNFDGLVFQDRSPSAMGDEGSIQFTQQLARRAAAFHAPLKTVGTIFIESPLKSTNATTAQDAERFSAFIAAYDYVAIVPADKNPTDLDTWITGLNSRLGLKPGDARNKKTVFLLEGDADAASNANSNMLVEQMRTLQLGGALNFGYADDDFLHDNPPLDQVAPAVSLRIHPR